NVPLELSNLVMKLLAKKPAERPGSAHAVVQALQKIDPKTVEMPARSAPKTKPQIGSRQSATGSRPKTSPTAIRRKPRAVWLAGGGVLGLVRLVALIVISWQPPHGSEELPLAKTFKNDLGIEFVLIPKGKSWLGGGGGKVGDREVEIKEDFYLGKYEVTQEE